jgi:PAS domain S-box-containing protein
LALLVAVGAVAVATLIRLELAQFGITSQSAPFTTYYLAIIVAAMVGGLWVGIVATALSASFAWLLFIPPELTLEMNAARAVSLSLFVIVSVAIVVIVTLLNKSLDWVDDHARSMTLLVDSAPYGIIGLNDEGRISSANPRAVSMFGYDHSELVGRPIDLLFPSANRRGSPGAPELLIELAATGETLARQKSGKEVPVEVVLTPVDREGMSGTIVTVLDITERKAAEARQKFLINELQHRSQNLFSVIQAIAARTLNNGAVKSAFQARILALSRAHQMLAEAAWSGAPLRDLIKSELGAFADNVSIDGCELVVNPTAAQQFALIIHELATNAAKHGALSSPQGRVVIKGTIDQSNGRPVFSMIWTERGGPRVRKPGRRGFGSTILIDAAKSFGSEAHLTFEPNGLSYQLQMSLSSIELAG